MHDMHFHPQSLLVTIEHCPTFNGKVNNVQLVIDGEIMSGNLVQVNNRVVGFSRRIEKIFLMCKNKSEEQLAAEEAVRKAEEALEAAKDVLNKVKEK